MEQKEILDKFYIHGGNTLRVVLQVLANLSTDGIHQWVEKRKPLKGETGLYKLLNSSDPISMKFLQQNVDLNQLKSYLDEIGLPFAFKEVPGGTNFYFKIKDEQLAYQALGKIFEHITKNPSDFAKKVVQNPHRMTFEQRLKYVKENKQFKGDLSKTPSVKAPMKGKR